MRPTGHRQRRQPPGYEVLLHCRFIDRIGETQNTTSLSLAVSLGNFHRGSGPHSLQHRVQDRREIDAVGAVYSYTCWELVIGDLTREITDRSDWLEVADWLLTAACPQQILE